ncbi:hypothetical protein EV193_101630 [Herbihabitans rhizosphaerae]|uniref:Uncharacterized protein n=1 Tax=Herbihabitans rhizosphaerae TaxID=1872711 RepID=A0A4Q7L8M0_9PSEU|nr:MafI family immunity protein [Herbihabitans rhizosphaerae]RZS44752.1 hypothetical protein EV193_101630 [Herbihabitans rhizosphaerae]
MAGTYAEAEIVLRQVVDRVGGELPESDVRSVGELIDAGELGVAYENLCTQLDEYEVEIDQESLAGLTAVAAYFAGATGTNGGAGTVVREWEEIHGFESASEFARFEKWIRDAVTEGSLTEVPVGERYGDIAAFDERWFREPAGQAWRLVAPDPPFTGVFLKVG